MNKYIYTTLQMRERKGLNVQSTQIGYIRTSVTNEIQKQAIYCRLHISCL